MHFEVMALIDGFVIEVNDYGQWLNRTALDQRRVKEPTALLHNIVNGLSQIFCCSHTLKQITFASTPYETLNIQS